MPRSDQDRIKRPTTGGRGRSNFAVRHAISTLVALTYIDCSPLDEKDSGPDESGQVHSIILGYDQTRDYVIPAGANPGPVPEASAPNLRFFAIGDQGVFLLLGQPGDPQGHLRTLAEIARTVSHGDTRQRLITAADPDEVIAVIRASSA